VLRFDIIKSMETYNPKKIEKKRQRYWEKNKIDFTDLNNNIKPKFYNLAMFFYPSGAKIHIGHAYNYTGSDVYGRYKKLCGLNVFQPMGYDAFGLPAENYAIKTGVHPAKSTRANINFGKKQLQALGLMYDWEKEINTSSLEYYKWTQWLFELLHKAGLAYQAEAPVNWCPSCKTVLANEQIINGCCERCDSEVIQKNLKQWFFKITKYAEKLLEGHKKLNWPERTIAMQKNWIGKSEGTMVKFSIFNFQFSINVFTTRIDTIFGVTALVLAPEHELVQRLKRKAQNLNEIDNYINQAKKKSELERTDLEKEKTGVELKGIYAINPLNNEKIPIWIGDYVIATYGGGAVMVVPAHDRRDWEFAKKYNIDIKPVVLPYGQDFSPEDLTPYPKEIHDRCEDPFLKLAIDKIMNEEAFCEDGFNINSNTNDLNFNFLSTKKTREKITEWLEKNKLGRKTTNYHLRDWLISRQRYWGVPIPIIYCDKCGKVLVPEKDLPVKLPNLKDFQPTESGESPLARVKNWVKVKCPTCNGSARRSTETMDTFVCSSWYYLRYLNPHLKNKPFDKKMVEKWLPVDQYCGGAEHACLHLLYARFITKVLFDQKLINLDEPFIKLNHQGMILASDGSKMSKSKGNVVIPDEYIKKYGADTLRIYILFIATFEDGGAWNDKGIVGAYKFLKRVWFLMHDKTKIQDTTSKDLIQKINYIIKKVGDDIENFKFNTAIAAMMEFVNAWSAPDNILSKKDAENFLKILAPFAPHIAEELWFNFKHKKSIFLESWPKYDKKLIQKETFELVIQINGKVRDKVEVDAEILEDDAKKIVLEREKIKIWLKNQEPKKIIFIKGKLVNIVV